MLRKQKWMLLGGLILLALCMIIPGAMVMASGSTAVSGTVPLNIYNVQVTNITTTSATISWNTNNPTGSSVTSQVSYGITTSYGSSVSNTSSGLHSVNLSSLSPGTIYDYQIQSTISGVPTATYAGSFTTAALPLHPKPIATNVILVSFPNPSDFGQTVLFGVGVVPTIGNGVPTGTVTLMDGSTAIGTNPLVFGLTAFSISSLSVGSHNITAVYSGDNNYLGSTSNVVIQKVHYDTKTNLISSVNPSISGQSVTFTATVTAAAGTPTGTVTFSDGSTVLGTGTLSSGKATYTTNALSVGSHPITASYGGDATNDVSTSNLVVQVVGSKNSAKITLSSSLNPSVFGQSVTFIATLSPSAATGTVQFQIDGTNFGSAVSLSGGKATSGATASLTVGSHNITAIYSGDGTYGGSSATLVQKVKSKTVCNWPSKPNPCNWGQPCIFNIQIGCQSPGTGTPTGIVTFYDGSNSLGNCSLSNGSASFSIGNLTVGSHNISFTYSGDDSDSGSTSGVVTQTVNPVSTITALSCSASTSVFGQSVTFIANVTPNTATGTVTFKDGTKTLGTATLSAGSATFSINSLAVGSHSITAVYGGDTNNNGSTSSSVTETVTKPVIGTTSLPNGTKNTSYSQTFSVSGGLAPYTWSISGAPSWLSLNVSTGLLSGKPTTSGTYSFTVKVTDSLGNTATQSFSIKVN
jgi:Bacterial Ig-like domain (group 3)/Fibronectin type III domain